MALDVVYVLESYYGYTQRDYRCYGVYTTWEKAKEAQQQVIAKETTQWVYFAGAGDGLYGKFRKGKFGGIYEEGLLQILARQVDKPPQMVLK